MGSSSSKFKKYLNHGDEYAAMQLFQSSPELQRNLNPNMSYGESHNHDTAMHYAAKHGMKHLLRTFLNDLGGNPNKKNGANQTSLHAACTLGQNKGMSALDRRAACVAYILQWRGALLEAGAREKIDLAAQDAAGDTALHLAAASGLQHCVEALLTAGSPLFTENKAKQTPCDLAVKNSHHAIAHILESKMVFDDSMDVHNEDELSQGVGDEVYTGLRTQDLQEAKDQLLVETSDMLQVPLFTAEALLRDNEWSREVLLEKWMKDAVACCQLAGVEPPESALLQHTDSPPASASDRILPEVAADAVIHTDVQCGICLMTVKVWEQPSMRLSCGHNFCTTCWESYLSSKILEGMHHDILCPAYQCSILVPLDVIESLVSPDLTKRYLHFDIKAFVESNKCIKWCPKAGCGRAVKLPEAGQAHLNVKAGASTSHAVDCGNGHFFCWECLGEAHAPSGCAQWRLWLEKVNQVRPEELDSSLKDMELASNCLWLVSNSKPCPNCASPIQKNEGCNHIKCSKCKFDFCWVCLEAWKKHSSATGGYFRCNRFPAASKADEKQGALFSEAIARSQQIQDLNRFIHYYTRFKNHENSRKLEEPLLTAVKHKMEVLAASLVGSKEIVSEKEKSCTKFIEDGVRELLKARRVLCGSYVHGFYLEDNGYNRTIFEFMQNELEGITEKLSEQVARPYLKTPRHAIMATTAVVRRKRHELVRAVAKGLVPPETPPSRRHRRRRLHNLLLVDPNNDDVMSDAIAASLKSLDPNNPWVKDADGRHNNLAAIYEWPDMDSERDSDVGRAVALSLVGECSREGCMRPRARNPRTHALHEYCSLWCAAAPSLVAAPNSAKSVTHDDSMDLAIALEMSRLQMIEDTVKRQRNLSSNKPKTSVSITQTDSETELSKAIELSLQQQTAHVGAAAEEVTPTHTYQKSTQDLTVDYFLKSLGGQNSINLFTSDSSEKTLTDKETAIFRPKPTEDGMFEISELHEGGFTQKESEVEGPLRKVRSTGDLTKRSDRRDIYRPHRHCINSSKTNQPIEDVLEGSDAMECPTVSAPVTDPPQPGPAGDNIVDLEVCHIMAAQEGSAMSNLTKRRHTMDWKKSASTSVRKTLQDRRNSTEEETNRSDSVKHLIEQVKNTLNAIDNDHSAGTQAWDQREDSTRSWQYQMYQFDSTGGEFSRHCPERASTGKIKSNPESCHAKLHSGTKSVTTLVNLKEYEHKRYTTKRVIFVGSDKAVNDAHKRAFKAAGGKILKKDGVVGSKEAVNQKSCSNLRIRIAKSPIVTDSSNEYETETGIPKSPTLFISGVSISRTPEPCTPPCTKEKRSPERKARNSNLSNLHGKINSYPLLNLIPATSNGEDRLEGIFPPEEFDDKRFLSSGRQSRSSSLTVPKTHGSDEHCKKLNTSCGAIPFAERRNGSVVSITPPLSCDTSAKSNEGIFTFGVCNHKSLPHGSFKTIPSLDEPDVFDDPSPKPKESADAGGGSGKSQSAAEPERDREMFRFPKSSTDGALSSVLHVQESNLSSDDFHEVLFLLERSPKQNSKRRKRSKKERDKVKEGLGKEDVKTLKEANSFI